MKPTVLIVDDDESITYMLELALKSDGFRVRLAADGMEGWEVFKADKPDIVLTDIKMPHMDGIELLGKIKEVDPELDVLLLTAHGELPTAIKALELGARRYLQKPIRQIGNIALILKDLIEQRRLVRDRRLIDRISQDLSQQLSLEDFLDSFLEHILSASSQIDCAFISRYDPETESLNILRSHGIPGSQELIGLDTQPSWSVGAQAFARGTITRLDLSDYRGEELTKLLSQNLPEPIRELGRQYPNVGVVGVPIISEGHPIASLAVANFDSLERLDDPLVNLLTTLCTQVGLYLRNAILLTDWQAQTSRLQAVLNSSLDGIVVIDPDGQIIEANPRYRSMLSPAAKLDTDAQKRLITAIRSSLDDGNQTKLLFTLDHPSSDEPTILEVHAARMIQNNEPIGIVASLRDITLSLSLDRKRDHLLRLARHEVGTPLEAIQVYAHNLLHLGHRLSPGQQTTNLERIASQAQLVQGLVEKTLTYSHFKEELLTLKRIPLDLSQMAKDLAQQTAALSEQQGIQFDAQIEPDLWVMGNESLRQAFQNLLDNARKYTSPGDMISWRAGRIRTHVRIEVTDNGMGIPTDELDRIFDPYYRASNAVKITGSGLGLSIVSDIISAHRGRIEVESKVGKGSRFTVTLMPISPPA
jgi:signal transduction histidine kinase/DNA-binding NarL/FixJ family response regulator